MKRTFFLLCAALLMISGCKKDAQKYFDGTWRISNKYQDDCPNSSDENTNYIVSDERCQNATWFCHYIEYSFNKTTLQQFNSEYVLGVFTERTLEGSFNTDEKKKEITICLDKLDETDCRTYDYVLKKDKIELHEKVANGCTLVVELSKL